MNDRIKLGDKVKCRITGLIGIATSRHEYINGCVRYAVQTPIDKDGKMPDAVMCDVQQLDVIKRAAVTVDRDNTGGPRDRKVPT